MNDLIDVTDTTESATSSSSTDESLHTQCVRNSYSSNYLNDNYFEFAHQFSPTPQLQGPRNDASTVKGTSTTKQYIRKCQSVIQLTSTGYANGYQLTRNHRHTIQIPIAASRIRLPIPTPTSVLMAIKQEHFLKKLFGRCQVNTYTHSHIHVIHIHTHQVLILE